MGWSAAMVSIFHLLMIDVVGSIILFVRCMIKRRWNAVLDKQEMLRLQVKV